MHYLPIPPGQGFKSSFTASGSETLKRSQCRGQLKLQSSEGSTGAGGSASKLTPRAAGKRLSSSPHGLLHRVAHEMVAGFLQWESSRTGAAITLLT